MKKLVIIGENYFGSFRKERIACRAIVVRDGKLLLSYETKTDTWMIPGGGLDAGETMEECCIRETQEETGLQVEIVDSVCEIDEYYEDEKYVNYYFFCVVTGEGSRKLTNQEMLVGMEPRWLIPEKIIGIFADHQAYAETDEMKRGMYLREYTALSEVFPLPLEGEHLRIRKTPANYSM